MNSAEFNQGLLSFLNNSPTPFHAVSNLRATLSEAGFQELNENDPWTLDQGGKYWVTRGNSSIIAFAMGLDRIEDAGVHMVGSHTDSPCLKLKPNAVLSAHGYQQLGVEVYGGVLLNPWFDRDLSLAGEVTLLGPNGALIQRQIDFQRAIAIIPSLAIHLDREANKNRAINPETYLPPIVSIGASEFDLNDEIIIQLKQQYSDIDDHEVVAFELSLYPTEPAQLIGLHNEFIASARLDNLLSCYVSARALLDSTPSTNRLIVCNDHEEVGSGSAVGARGTFLRSVIERITQTNESYARAIAKSMLVSTDNAHGVHPNFADRHARQHGSVLNAGPVIKVNSNQAYASTNATIGVFKAACRAAGVPVQSFVARADMRCGSTLGPLTATVLGVKTVDVGVPTFAMHSIRELAGSEDPHSLYLALQHYFEMRSIS